MTVSGWITMAVIVGLVWGGFGYLVVKALRKEAGKANGGVAEERAG